MLHYIIIWFLVCSVLDTAILHAGTLVYTEKATKGKIVDKGVLLIQMVATLLVVIAPFIT